MVKFLVKNHDGRIYLKDTLKGELSSGNVTAIAHDGVVLLISNNISDDKALQSLNFIRRELRSHLDAEDNRSEMK